ncbi:sulfotransferase family 2 domain-containing protein [Salinisphaera sp. Q1T1-3]|uniref:sulfotransferase family 2 domain-containing protein n=1 Tax=Salinisphaera sp. Q1T1-3 TaxID=2321229 RepID=UPI001314621E|nr:sulfotransferase family 2 domain-containing protein [Salinisphaera sp. Q1T1-3]
MKSADFLSCRSRRNPLIFDSEKRFIYFPNNKAAQTSIARNMLRDRAIVWKDDKIQWEKNFWLNLAENIYRPKFSFTVVRNPYDIVVSAFHYLKDKNETVGKYDSFSSFCVQELQYRREEIDHHFLPQSEKMFKDGVCRVDYVARVESLNEDWSKIASAIGAKDSELVHKNPSERKKEWLSYYDKKCINIINNLYEEDFYFLDYEKIDKPE